MVAVEPSDSIYLSNDYNKLRSVHDKNKYGMGTDFYQQRKPIGQGILSGFVGNSTSCGFTVVNL